MAAFKSLLASPVVAFALGYERVISALMPRQDGVVRGNVIDALSDRVETVHHNGIELKFVCPNRTTALRAQTFSTKEPETLAWIDVFPQDPILWDIGANVGLYAIYAAKRGAKVYAFEPSVLNIELLARNIALNNVSERVCLVPLPLSDQFGENEFILSRLEHGGAHSAFGVDYGHDGKPMKAKLAYSVLGITMDSLIDQFGLSAPDYIKMDVDGIEHHILKGGQKTLANPKLRSLLVEINDSFKEQSEGAGNLLRSAGFSVASKHPTNKSSKGEFANSYNYIWTRSASDAGYGITSAELPHLVAHPANG